MRIVRTLILLTGIGFLLPSPPEQAREQTADAALPGVISTAMQAVSDVAGFCARQPGVCETAGYVAGKVEAKAKYSARLIYEWASESSTGSDRPGGMAQTDPLSTGSAPALRLARDGQSTLKLEDFIPAWRQPAKG